MVATVRVEKTTLTVVTASDGSVVHRSGLHLDLEVLHLETTIMTTATAIVANEDMKVPMDVMEESAHVGQHRRDITMVHGVTMDEIVTMTTGEGVSLCKAIYAAHSRFLRL